MYLPKASIEAISGAIDNLHAGPGDVVLVLVGEENRPDLEGLVSALSRKKVSFLGGVFPGVIHGSRHHAEGAVLARLPAVGPPLVIQGLDRESITLPVFSEALTANSRSRYTAIILADGLAANIAAFLAELFGVLGNTVNYLGGGAGLSTLRQQPCVFTSAGVFQNAAVAAFIPLESALGVRHGWRRLVGPIVATKTHKNIVAELNWKRAFDVYREIVQRDSGTNLTKQNFAAVASAYPFGIVKEGTEDVVRDPIAVNDAGDLVCVGEVPENTVLNILKGKSEWLIAAAGQAASDCLAVQGRAVRQSLIVDCVSRSLFLQKGFDKELETVTGMIRSLGAGLTAEGVLSIGEISSSGQGFLEFFNKTIVVGILYDA